MIDSPADNILFLNTVDSTNRYASDHFDELADGTLVWAEEQTAGRGRLGRSWLSPKGENLYVSWVVKQIREPLFLAAAAASLAVLETLREAADNDLSFYLKWPNDIYCGPDKVSGILSEGVVRETLRGVIVGMGININSPEATLKQTGIRAASLHSLDGRVFSLKKMILRLAKHVCECYIMYLNDPDGLFARWKEENLLIGQELDFVLPDGRVIRSPFLDIAEDGGAVILDGGRKRIFSCGDVRIAKESLNFKTSKK